MLEKKLDGFNILITGASSGIGRSVAIGLASKGARVGLMARREALLKDVVDEIKKSGGDASYEVTDVIDYTNVKSSIDSFIEDFGRIDGIINNAGVGMFTKPFSKHEPGELDKIIDTNLKGVMHSTLAALPHMEQNKSGRIVNTSSLSTFAYNQLPFFSIYASSKWGINGFTKHLAYDERKYNITVNAVLPGWTATEMTSGDYTQNLLKEAGITPLPPEKLVPLYGFFFTEDAEMVSGTLVMVDHVLDAWEMGRNMPENERNWRGISGILHEKYSKREMVDLGTNKKLIDYLLKI
ncbi:MAG: SDR family NAD(P)-dependent oxidoreductase [Candidatus Hodarchaeota archaeon]